MVRDWIDKLEIWFWTTWVALVRRMRQLRWQQALVAAGVILLALSLMAASISYFSYGPQNNQQALVPGKPHARPQNDQFNTLLVLVDRLGPQAQLEGAWIVIYDHTQKLSFLPLFPGDNGAQMDAAFRLDPTGKPAVEFEAILEQAGLWWDSYLVIDHGLLLALMRLGDVIPPTTVAQAGEEPFEHLGVTDGLFPLRAQVAVLQRLCGSERLFTQVQPEILAVLLYADQRTDLKQAQIEQSIQNYFQSGRPHCDFPTITGGRQP